MVYRRTSMRKIREILRLKEAGLSKRQITRSLKVSRPVVTQYLTDCRSENLCYEDIEKMSDSKLLSILEKGKERKSKRYRVLSGKFGYFLKELKRTGVTLLTLWEEYRLEYPDGYEYSIADAFCHRLIHSASKIALKGDSVRKNYSEKEKNDF